MMQHIARATVTIDLAFSDERKIFSDGYVEMLGMETLQMAEC